MFARAAAPDDAPASLRRSRLFAEAATVGEGIYKSFPDNIWAQRALITLETFAVPLAFWFKPICVAVALFWYARPPQTLLQSTDHAAHTGWSIARPKS